eukprot:CAMPEP_0185765514 /NCGR_PEP_ID=MMETSP1174-20130828/30481_1 /TAXON_ID=35687 /ORGANISM="Dictyocha speculum, Strain CCMP1381" /LENGTH=251 /DNA_ID=CAMNT_0028448693 /DNA_START=167 /DNA_END=922 /DNA_ORIENTATION=+
MSGDGDLLYMDFYKWQQELLTGMGAYRLDLPDHIQLQANSKKGARIGSETYATDQFRKIRMSYFDAGDKVQVFNSLWYPRTDFDAPVLGIDLLCFGQKTLLCVVDCQPLAPQAEEPKHAQTFRDIRDRYPALCGKMSQRHYDENQFFSDGMLFGRLQSTEEIKNTVLPAFQEYVGAYVDLIGDMTPDHTSCEAVRSHQCEYDQYNSERDPAHGLFTSYFGEPWANDFVHDFLFAGSERKVAAALAEEEVLS